MKNKVIYLKADDTNLWTDYKAFNKSNLSEVTVEKGAVHFKQHNFKEDFTHSIGYDLTNGYEFCTREEFNDFFKSQSELLNQITKEL